MSSVLYDTPGPRAKARNWIYTVLFLVALAALLWWVLAALDERDQLDWESKWKPWFGDTASWETYLLPGLETTLTAAGLSILIALPIGAVLGISRMSDHSWIRWPAGVIVEFFRAIPVLVLMLAGDVIYRVFADFEHQTRLLYAVVTGLVLYNASVLAEVVRAGILSIPRGQTEAALAVGMRKGQLMRSVLLPQAVTAMLPAIVSQLVVIVKDTAIGGAVLGLEELITKAGSAASFYANTVPTLIVVALIYIVINFLLTSLASGLEKWLRTRKKGGGSIVDAEMLEEQAPGVHLDDTKGGGRGG